METTGYPDDADRDAGQLVGEYLAELEREAARLPWNARNELLEDVRSHIEVALAEIEETARPEKETSTPENPDGGSSRSRAAQIRDILAALGEPREIVAAAAEEAAPHRGPTTLGEAREVFASTTAEQLAAAASPELSLPQPLTLREKSTILLLLFGAILWGFGWLVGVVLLWSSPRWRLRERLLGTLIWPGGMLAVFLLVVLPGKTESCVSSSLDQVEHCTSRGWSLPGWLAIPTVLLVLFAPVGVAYFLARTARNRPGVEPGRGGAGGLFATIAVAFGVLLLIVGAGAVIAVGGVARQIGSGGGLVGPADPVQQPAYSSSAVPVSSPSS
jgi:hypothetical protein